MNEFAHYAAVSTIVALPALGVGIGQGIVNAATLEAINRQPEAAEPLRRLSIISLTLTETAELLGIVIAILLLFDKTSSAYSGYGYLAIILALGLPGFLIGLASAATGKAALMAVARQPLFAPRITQLLLITQTIIQTPAIFGFIIALFLRNQIPNAHTFDEGIRLFSSGLTFGLGSIGPIIGLALFTQKAVAVTGINREIFPKLRTFTFISQALIEAPVIFSLIVSLFIAASTLKGVPNEYLIFLTAAFMTGITTFGASFNSGRTGAAAAEQIGLSSMVANTISRASIIAQTFIDTTAIYGLVLAFILLLRR